MAGSITRGSIPPRSEKAVVLGLDRQIQEGVGERRDADVGHAVAGGAAAVLVAAAIDVGAAAAVARLEDDVDHAGNGVGAVLGGGAILQHLDVIDRGHRDVVQVGRGAALEGAGQHRQVGGAVAPLAVDQHQGVVRAQAAQARGERHGRHVAAEGLGVERRQVLRQRLDQVGLAGARQRGGVEHLHRGSAVLHGEAGGAGAGDDHDAAVGDAGGGGRVAGGGLDGRCRLVVGVGASDRAGQQAGDAGMKYGLVHGFPLVWTMCRAARGRPALFCLAIT